MAGNGHQRSLPAKPEVEIWQKPDKWTRNRRLPIRLPIDYGVYRRGIDLDLYKFLVDPNTEHGPTDYPYDARKLLTKSEVVIADVVRSSTGDRRKLNVQNGWKRPPVVTSSQTGSRNMAETRQMNSQPSTSYSTSYTLLGLSRRYLSLYSWRLTVAPM